MADNRPGAVEAPDPNQEAVRHRSAELRTLAAAFRSHGEVGHRNPAAVALHKPVAADPRTLVGGRLRIEPVVPGPDSWTRRSSRSPPHLHWVAVRRSCTRSCPGGEYSRGHARVLVNWHPCNRPRRHRDRHPWRPNHESQLCSRASW